MPAVLSSFLTTEHVDLNFGYSGGTWSLQPRDFDTATSYAPEDALLYVGEPSLATRSAGSAFDFIGVGSGESYYRLPQSQNSQLPYLGVSGYGVPSSNFDRYNPSSESKGRVSGLGRWLKMSLVDVQHFTPDGQAGGGQFSVWQSGDLGPIAYMSSYNDGVSNPNGSGLDATDGISSDDALWILAGGHLHYNFGFTEPGRYEVTVKLSGYLGDNGVSTPNVAGYSESQPFTIYFSVGSVGELEFDSSTYTVNEADGTASVTVRRVGGSDGRITVNYATSDGTATADADYTGVSGTLTFNDQETEKVIQIPILDDDDVEGNETVNLTLSAAGPSSIQGYLVNYESDANGLLGTQTTAELTILDDDSEPLSIFSSGSELVATLSTGHVDIGVAFEDEAWDLHIHDEENDVEYEPAEALLFVTPQAERLRPPGEQFDFIGVGAGETFWQLPHSPPNPETLLLGFGTEEIEEGTFADDLIQIRLKGVSGPGQFSVWRSTDDGPLVFMATSDGITADDLFVALAGGHEDLNWGFTARGDYEITFEATATLPDGTVVSSGDVTYHFAVDNIAPPRVEEVLVNGGEEQRSNIETLSVRFSGETNVQALIDSGDIATAVQLFSGGQLIDLAAARFSYDAATFTLVVDVTTDGFGGSRSTLLSDGLYDLQLDPTLILDSIGQGLLDDDGTDDGVYTASFHRLEGDFNGNRSVGLQDVVLFFDHFGGIEGLNDRYDFAFDLTGLQGDPDGIVGVLDLVRLASRIGSEV